MLKEVGNKPREKRHLELFREKTNKRRPERLENYVWCGPSGMFFSLSHNARTHGHPMTLNGGRFRTDSRRYIFTQCIVNLGYLLPQETGTETSLSIF